MCLKGSSIQPNRCVELTLTHPCLPSFSLTKAEYPKPPQQHTVAPYPSSIPPTRITGGDRACAEGTQQRWAVCRLEAKHIQGQYHLSGSRGGSGNTGREQGG